MLICQLVLSIISTVVRGVIAIVRTITETVCNLVTTIIVTIVEVVKKICGWLPWPLNKLCDWVTQLIVLVQVIWEWVCEEVIKRIIDYVEVIWIYIEYVLTWVCWLVDWIILKWLDLLFCLAGVHGPRCISVCVKVTNDANGAPVISQAEVLTRVDRSNAILEKCNIRLELESIEFVDRHIENVKCSAGGIFSGHFIWFNRNKCYCCNGLTVFYVDSIEGSADGCSIPPSTWIALEEGSDVGDIVHELGHLSGLFKHHSDPDNVMGETGAGTNLTSFQCCIIRISKFTRSCAERKAKR